MTIEVTGSVTTTVLETTLPSRESFISDFRNTPSDQLHGYHVVELGPGLTLNRESFLNNTDYR